MDLIKKEKDAIQLIKDFEPMEGYWLAYSRGKDSDVIYGGFVKGVLYFVYIYHGFDIRIYAVFCTTNNNDNTNKDIKNN